jgi:hypothetical protein
MAAAPKARILAIGIPAAPKDRPDMAHMTGEMVAKHTILNREIFRNAGYDFRSMGVSGRVGFEKGDFEAIKDVLEAWQPDVFCVGYGLRSVSEFTDLFERVVEAVRELSPNTKLAFPSAPDDTMDAVRRIGF